MKRLYFTVTNQTVYGKLFSASGKNGVLGSIREGGFFITSRSKEILDVIIVRNGRGRELSEKFSAKEGEGTKFRATEGGPKEKNRNFSRKREKPPK